MDRWDSKWKDVRDAAEDRRQQARDRRGEAATQYLADEASDR